MDASRTPRWRRSMAAAATAALAAGLLLAPAVSPGISPEAALTPAAAAGASAPQPVVDGNVLRDARDGKVWVPRGANWPSMEYACAQGWGYSVGNRSAAEANAIASWGMNFVRLPLNQACWLGVDGAPAYGTRDGYRAAVTGWVQRLNEAGLAVLLDLHWSAPAGYSNQGQRAMADAQSLTFWTSVAGAFRDNPSVFFDAYNEPYSRWSPGGGLAFELTWACWRDGGCQAPVENDEAGALSGSTYEVVGMTALVAAIRDAGATQPILLAGLDYANDLRGWLAHAPADDQLVASWHNYPGQRCKAESCWNSEIAAVAADVPVIMTEVGQTDGNANHLLAAVQWAEARSIGYSPWAWWAVNTADSLSNGRYALITDTTSFAPKAPSGTAYREHLESLLRPVQNLPIKNASFEGSRTGWATYSGPKTLKVIKQTSSKKAKAGKYYLSSGKAKKRAFGQTLTRSVVVGEEYEATVWLRTTSSTGFWTTVRLQALGGSTEERKVRVKVGKSWTKVTVRLPITAAGHDRIRIRFQAETTSRSLHLDAVSLTVRPGQD